VSIGKGTVVQPGAWVRGPAIIGENCEIRHGAYVGANVILGNNVVIGHASEINHSILMDGARAAHFAFVGHSIVGHSVNLGAGVKLANFKITGAEITVEGAPTGLQKLGAVIGDDSSLGCNTVTQPGAHIGKRVMIYPLALVRGVIASHSILKVRQTQQTALEVDPQKTDRE
jgi:NDP-sugar pyrophosphorylase family protein